MPTRFGQKKHSQHYVFHTVITTVLLCSIFLAMVGFLYVDAMNEVDTSNVEPMAHAIDFVNVMREDKVFYEQTKEELMKNAPYEEDGFFRVPKIN